MVFKLVTRKAKFYKDIGFKTKKQALIVLRAEAKQQNKKIHHLFDSQESFESFSQNILIPELQQQQITINKIQSERNNLKMGDLESVKKLIEMKYIFNDGDLNIIRNLTKKDKFIIKFKFADGSNKTITMTDLLWSEIKQFLKQDYWIAVEEAFSVSDQFTEIQQKAVVSAEIEKVLVTKEFKDKDGSFFKFSNTTTIDLERYQIYKDTDLKPCVQDEHCLIHTLQLHDIKDSLLNQIKLSFYQQEKETNNFLGASFAKCNLKKVSKIINKKIILHTIKNKVHAPRKETYGDEGEEIHICLYKNHYFIYDDKTDFTIYSIKHYEELKDIKDFNKIYKNSKKGYKKTNGKKTNSLSIITTLFNKGLFSEKGARLNKSDSYQSIKKDILKIPLDNIEDEQSIFEFGKEENLKKKLKEDLIKIKPSKFVNKKKYIKYIKQKKAIEKKLRELNTSPEDYFYADLETDVSETGNLHKLLLAGIMHHDDERPKIYINKGKLEAYYKMFDYVLSTKVEFPKIYFHNLKYDYNVLKPMIYLKEETEKDGQIYKVQIIYKKKKIELIDSYKMISIPLRDFNNTFGLKKELNKKEAIGYTYYTAENILEQEVKIEKYIRHVKESDKKTFYENVKMKNEKGNYIFNYTPKKQTFSPILYYSYYLKYDVLVLKEGLKELDNKIKNITKGKCTIYDKQLTISSLTNKYMKSEGCFTGVYEVSGNLREYISQAITGGRVSCLESTKRKILTEAIADYDAVSLYPSAIYRMCLEKGLPIGACKRISTFNKKELDEFDYYICTVKITKINKKQQISFIHSREEGESLRYINEVPKGGMITIIDNITLDDYINFHDIEYEIIDGVYWNNGTNKRFGEVIKNLFDERLKEKKLKKEFSKIDENKAKGHDTMQRVIKLMLNSAYGKTILKKSKKKRYIIDNESLDNYIYNNFNTIKEISKINERQSIVVRDSYDDSSNMAHIGVMVLSYSKRIMNEVMNLANDNAIKIYYQDTDSMHMNNADVNKLEDLYKLKYNKVLNGKSMGQFHSDFDMDDACGPVTACKTIILDKKAYIDILQSVNSAGMKIYNYHIRLKGVTQAGIAEQAQIHGGYDVLFEKLAEGQEIKFTLNANDKVLFEFTKQGVRTRTKFVRKVKFN